VSEPGAGCPGRAWSRLLASRTSVSTSRGSGVGTRSRARGRRSVNLSHVRPESLTEFTGAIGSLTRGLGLRCLRGQFLRRQEPLDRVLPRRSGCVNLTTPARARRFGRPGAQSSRSAGRVDGWLTGNPDRWPEGPYVWVRRRRTTQGRGWRGRIVGRLVGPSIQVPGRPTSHQAGLENLVRSFLHVSH